MRRATPRHVKEPTTLIEKSRGSSRCVWINLNQVGYAACTVQYKPGVLRLDAVYRVCKTNKKQTNKSFNLSSVLS